MGNSVEDINPLPSRIAALVHAHFDALPKRSKPVIRADGTAEWIPMTGIVLVKGENTPSETLSCVAVTTGAKCLPASQIPNCNGLVLHDCHAEILAMRAFNFWLLSECHAVLAREENSSEKDGPASPYIWRHQPLERSGLILPPFEFHRDVNIYMYCTCAPCGDASMELVMAAQDDPTPWALPHKSTLALGEGEGEMSSNPALLDGRAHFSNLGIVRRKPARADAQSTMSKSCSDKLALRQVTSLLSHEASLLVAVTENAYIKGLVLPEEEISRVGCARCFGDDGRMKDLGGRMWPITRSSGVDNGQSENQNRHQYKFRPFDILSIPDTQLKSLWPFRKPKASDPVPEKEEEEEEEEEEAAGNHTPSTSQKKTKPGNISAVWVRAPTVEQNKDTSRPSNLAGRDNGNKNLPVLRGSKTGLFENIINGVKQGHRASSPGLRGASALSRAKTWEHWNGVMEATRLFEEDHGIMFRNEAGVPGIRSTGATSAYEALTYREFKKEPSVLTDCVKARKDAMQAAKVVLGGWVPNAGDEDWGWDLGGLVDSRNNLVDSGNGPVGSGDGSADLGKRKR